MRCPKWYEQCKQEHWEFREGGAQKSDWADLKRQTVRTRLGGSFFTSVKNITKDTTMGQDQEGKGLSTLGSLFRVSMLVESSLPPTAFPLSPTPLPCFMFFHFIHYCITYLFTLSIVCVLKKLCNLHKGRAVCVRVGVHSCSLLHSYYLAGYTPESMFSSLDMWCRSAGGSRRLGKLMWHRLKTNLREMER